MSWEIKLDSKNIEYEFEKNNYQTYDINLVGTNHYQEKSSGYKEPDDIVVEETYQADSEHGLFIWKVIARSTGFNTYADDIENTQEVSVPENCETNETPSFSIRMLED